MDERGRRELGRVLLETFANALLTRTLPRIQKWLQTRLGPAARLDAMEVEGSRVHLLDAQVPLGSRILFRASRASFVAHAEDLVAGLPPAHLERLRGTIEITAVDGPPIRADVEIEGDAPSTGAEWIEGKLTLRVRVAGVELSGSARATVTSEQWRIENVLLSSPDGATLAFSASGNLAADARLSEARFDATSFPSAAIAALASALAGERVPRIRLASAARVDGYAKLTEDDVEADLEMKSAQSRLSIRREHASMRVRGTLAWADVLPDGFGIDGDACELDLRIVGANVEGSARSRSVRARWLRTPFAIHAAFFGSYAELSAEGDGILATGRASLGEDLSGELEGSIHARIIAITERSAAERGVAMPTGGVWGGVAPPEEIAGRELDGILALRATLAGTRESPRLDAQLSSDRIGIADRSFERVVARAELDAHGASVRASARVGHGTVSISRAADGELRARAARADVAPFLALFDLHVAALEKGQLWAELSSQGSDGWGGAAHIETPRSRVTLDPLVLSPAERAVHGTRVRALIAAEDIPSALLRGKLELELTLAHLASARREVHGTLRGRDLSWGMPRQIQISEAHASLELRGDTLHVRDARAAMLGGHVRFALCATSARLRIDELALENIALPDVVPEGDVRLDGALARSDGALRGTLSARSAHSTLGLRAVLGDDFSLSGSELDATLATGDLARLTKGWVPRPLDARWEMHARLEGTLRAPIVVLSGRAAQQSFELGSVRLDFEDVLLRAELARSSVRWSELSGKGHGGHVRSRGAIANGAASARLEVEGIRIGELFGAPLDGALVASIDLWRGAARATIARGILRLDAPSYPFLARAAPTWKTLELPAPPLVGTRPFEARALRSADGFRFTDISAAVEGLAVRGELDVANDGALVGLLVLVPEEKWLRCSRLLKPIASLLGGASVPISIGGSLQKPRMRADVWGAIDRFVARSALGRRLRVRLEGIAPSTPERPSRAGDSSTARATASLLTTDAILDRLAEDPPDAAELFELLLERGLASDEIAARVARR